MGRKPVLTEQYNYRCNPSIMKEFDKVAESKGMSRSDRLRHLIYKDIEENKFGGVCSYGQILPTFV